MENTTNQNMNEVPMNAAPTNTGNEITIDDGSRTAGQFAISYQQSGRGGCIPVVNGQPRPELMFGYVSETDKQACMKLIEKALIATKGDTYKALNYIQNAVRLAASDIKADEAVTVEGVEFIIDYSTKKIYAGTAEVANLDDVTCELPQEAVKIMLMDRAKHAITVKHTACTCCDTWDDDGCDEDLDEAYDEGYDDGYSEGYDEGYDDGYDEGHDDGVADVIDEMIN